jgi:7-cyano-7-deazaguanine synthase
MDAAARLCDWQPLQVLAPFITATKADIVKVGAALGVPFAQTRTCYNDGLSHCGACGACVERREAFKLAGVSDPTMYCAI